MNFHNINHGFTPTLIACRRISARRSTRDMVWGFTLIELLVVISIISLLASIVLTSVNSARAKARDAAIKSQLSMIRTSAALAYDTTGNFDTVCDADSNAGRQYRAAYEQSTKANPSYSICLASNTTGFFGLDATSKPATPDKWAVSILLWNGSWFCVDYRGSGQEQSERGIDNSPLDMEC